MKITNIQNNNVNFNGKAAVIGKLSEVSGKCVERNKQYLGDLLYSKHFDLYIKEDAKDKFLELTAVRPEDFNDKNKPRIFYKIALSLLEGENENSNKMLQRAAYESVRDYGEKQPPTFKEKVKLAYSKAMGKFIKIFQDEDEV